MNRIHFTSFFSFLALIFPLEPEPIKIAIPSSDNGVILSGSKHQYDE